MPEEHGEHDERDRPQDHAHRDGQDLLLVSKARLGGVTHAVSL